MIVPLKPTTVPLFGSAKETACRSFPCGKGFCQNHCAFDELVAKNSVTIKREESLRRLFIISLPFSFENNELKRIS
jgi:hypothetical protein